MKNITLFLLIAFTTVLFIGCGGSSGGNNSDESNDQPADQPSSGEGNIDDETEISLLPGTYMAIGCGITKGSSPTIGPPWPDLIKIKNIDVINAAASGTHASYGASRIEYNINKYRPSLVMVLYGVNDISAGVSIRSILASLEEIIQVVQYYGGDVIVGTIPVVSKYSSSEASDAQDLNIKIRNLCTQYRIQCADVSAKMKYDDSLYLDGFHPTPEGHALIFNAFRSKIRKVTGK